MPSELTRAAVEDVENVVWAGRVWEAVEGD